MRVKAAKYVIIKGKLYKRGYAEPFLRCLDPDEASYVLREIHKGVCGNHSGGRSLAKKCVRQGYYWPTMERDATELVRKCDKCQRYAHMLPGHPGPLNPVVCPWPFAKWAIDLIGQLPMGRGQAKFAFVAVDYFTKWIEAEPLSKVTEGNCINFVWKNIIC